MPQKRPRVSEISYENISPRKISSYRKRPKVYEINDDFSSIRSAKVYQYDSDWRDKFPNPFLKYLSPKVEPANLQESVETLNVDAVEKYLNLGARVNRDFIIVLIASHKICKESGILCFSSDIFWYVYDYFGHCRSLSKEEKARKRLIADKLKIACEGGF